MAYLRRKLLCAMAASAMLATTVLPASAAPTANASGEVRRVDANAGRVTIRHGAISALELPAMTLVYQAEPALLVGISAGDKVTFTATVEAEKYIVIAIKK